jgi:L-alanine-DL-glutamate epimerase-like enolase superfamily enzyme
MKTTLKQIAEQSRQAEKAERDAIKAEIANPSTPNDRRNFLKKAALGGIALGGMIHLSVEDTIAQTTQNVSRSSSPSELKITDLRVAQKGYGGGGFATRLIKIYTNQGITGIGDIRDGTDQRFALFLKSKIVGLNPCNVEMIFKVIKQFGYHGRQGGGVSAVEMACWDICGKALGVPVWQLLGGRYRDKMRLYADTPDGRDDADQLARIKNRIEVEGFTWLKMDLSSAAVASANPGSLVNNEYWRFGTPRPAAPPAGAQGQRPPTTGQRPPVPQASLEQYMSYNNTEHPFTQIQITEKGLALMAERVAKVRSMVGDQIPISTDHFGYMDENQFIRLARVVEPYRLSWLEDTVPWFYHDRLKALKEASTTPICTGEDIYMLGGMLGGFKSLIDAQCVDVIHPDLVSAGGILETKKIGDYAEEAGIPMAMHHNSSPVAFMANIHCAAATENALVLEFHGGDMLKDWEEVVIKTDGKPLMEKGFGLVPLTAPGLGIEINDEKVKSQMPKDAKYFDETPEWDSPGRSYDKLWI